MSRLFVADAHHAHHGGGKRFVVRADEKLTVLIEIESAVHAEAKWLDELIRFFRNS